MASDEAIRTIGKQGFFVDEWKGEYSLTAAYEATNGKFYRKLQRKRSARINTPTRVVP